jgi:hypothetical protein
MGILVSAVSARIEEVNSMPVATELIHCDPEILGGTPVFVGTRVPFSRIHVCFGCRTQT